MSKSYLEEEFLECWQNRYPHITLVREHKPIERRRFRFDFTHLESKVAIEISGGTWTRGRHATGAGLESDYTKLNLAQAKGWIVFQLTAHMINFDWIDLIADTINARL